MKDVLYYELFGGKAFQNHAFVIGLHLCFNTDIHKKSDTFSYMLSKKLFLGESMYVLFAWSGLYICLPITKLVVQSNCCLTIWQYNVNLYFLVIKVKLMFVEKDSTSAWR